MIQRIQSVYLFFISVFSILSLTGNFFSFSNDSGKLLISLFPVNPEIHVSGSVFPVLITLTTILLILIALLALITLFLSETERYIKTYFTTYYSYRDPYSCSCLLYVFILNCRFRFYQPIHTSVIPSDDVYIFNTGPQRYQER
jgi:hypothetical protein